MKDSTELDVLSFLLVSALIAESPDPRITITRLYLAVFASKLATRGALVRAVGMPNPAATNTFVTDGRLRAGIPILVSDREAISFLALRPVEPNVAAGSRE